MLIEYITTAKVDLLCSGFTAGFLVERVAISVRVNVSFGQILHESTNDFLCEKSEDEFCGPQSQCDVVHSEFGKCLG